MTKYYVGYLQDNDEYVYVASIDNANVKVLTIKEGAIGFDKVELAESLLKVAKSIVANRDYVVLEITTEIKEVSNNE